MRILHVIPGIAPCYGGPSKAIFEICQALIENGVHVDVATTNANGKTKLKVPLGSPVRMDGVTIYFFDRQYPKSYTFSIPLTNWLRKNIRNYDLVHIHALFSYSSVPAAYYARKYKIPFIIRPIGTLSPFCLQKKQHLKKMYLKIIEKRNLQQCSGVHFTAEDEMMQAYTCNIKIKKFVVPIGIRVDKYRSYDNIAHYEDIVPSLQGKTVILFLSRLHPIKGLELLLSAFSYLIKKRNDFVFILAGSGELKYEAKIGKLISLYGLAAQTIKLGFVDAKKKIMLLNSSDIFVLPSYHENYGIAVVEAMAAGLPVIISDKVSIHREISDNKAGIVTKCNVEDIVTAFEKLLNDPLLRHDLGKNGQYLVKEKFGREYMAKQLIAVYKSAIKSNKNSKRILCADRITA